MGSKVYGVTGNKKSHPGWGYDILRYASADLYAYLCVWTSAAAEKGIQLCGVYIPA